MSNTISKNIKCPVCDGIDIRILRKFRGKHIVYQNMDLAQCNFCEMVFACLMPNKEALEEYNASFFQINPNAGQPEDVFATAFYAAIARLRVAHLDTYVGKHNSKINSVLELGPGPGFFVSSWLDKYPQTKYFAIETDRTCHQSLQQKQVTIINPSIKNEEIVDMVVMSHVLEHVTEPNNFIKSAVENLRKGGLLFIEVPCRDWEHKNIEEPHLLFFDKKPMRLLLQNLGFENIEVGYFGQKIEALRTRTYFGHKWKALKHKLIMKGIHWPFSSKRNGVEMISDPLERAALSVFEATNIESSDPAWWLRAVATKK